MRKPRYPGSPTLNGKGLQILQLVASCASEFCFVFGTPGSLNCPENVGPRKRVRISLSTDGLFFWGSGWTEILSTFAIFQMQKTNQAGNVGVMLLEFTCEFGFRLCPTWICQEVSKWVITYL